MQLSALQTHDSAQSCLAASSGVTPFIYTHFLKHWYTCCWSSEASSTSGMTSKQSFLAQEHLRNVLHLTATQLTDNLGEDGLPVGGNCKEINLFPLTPTIHLSLTTQPSPLLRQYPPYPAPLYHSISAHKPFREFIIGMGSGLGSPKRAGPHASRRTQSGFAD